MEFGDDGIQRRGRRVSYGQLKNLLAFMECHRELARGDARTTQARHRSKILWAELTAELNAHGNGTMKNSEGWSKYWSDYKNKLKVKNRATRCMRARATGVGRPAATQLSDTDIRALAILGPQFAGRTESARVEVRPTVSTTPVEHNDYIHVVVKSEFSNSDPLEHMTQESELYDAESRPVSSAAAQTEPTVPTAVRPPPTTYISRTPRRARCRPAPSTPEEARRTLQQLEEKRLNLELKQAEAQVQLYNLQAANTVAFQKMADAASSFAESQRLIAESLAKAVTVMEKALHECFASSSPGQ